MLICKGRSVHFVMVDDARVSAPRGAAMLHDPKGTSWGKNSLLFVAFRKNVRAPTEKEYEGDAKHYLGKNHRPKIGSVEGPARALSRREKIVNVLEI